MGKLSSIIITLIFVGAIGLLVYFFFRAKQKRNMGLSGNRWSNVFFGQNRNQQCNGNQIQNQSHPYEGGQMGAIGYPQHSDSHVPHSIVNPNAQQYPGYPGYPGGYPQAHNTPYPIGHPPNMPMPGSHFEQAHHVQGGPPSAHPSYPYPPSQSYPQPGPEELPPPYSAVVGSQQYHGQRY